MDHRMAIGVGAFLGGLSAAALNRYLPGQRTAIANRGLVAAAAIYPLAQLPKGLSARPQLAREGLALAATLGLGAVARRMPDARARAVVAGGWTAHAAFDLLHDRGSGSWLPSWYPPLCVGFDVAFALLLAVGASGEG